MYNFLWFLFYSIWAEYAILSMYLFDLNIFVWSNFRFKFVRLYKARFTMQWTQIAYLKG